MDRLPHLMGDLAGFAQEAALLHYCRKSGGKSNGEMGYAQGSVKVSEGLVSRQ
ncbi:MAG: hypothetical protein ACOY4H_05630 [Thermodesulfobacteriota bacterium]